MKNKIKIRWKSGLILLAGLYFLFYYFLFNFDDIFIEFFKCNFNIGYSDFSVFECAGENITPFLFLVLLSGIFVFSIYKTEKAELENKNKLNRVLRFNGAIMLVLFFLFLGFNLMGYQFSNLMETIPPDDTMIGLPPKTHFSFFIDSAMRSLIFSFFSTLFFSYIPSRIKIKF